MTPQVLTYILVTAIRAIGRFFAHWYTEGSRNWWHFLLDYINEMERLISLRIMLVNWYKPLYGDYTRMGRAVGIPIRLFRIVVGITFYSVVFAVFAVAYAVYLALPIFLLSRLV